MNLWTFHTCQCDPRPAAYDDGGDIPRCTRCQMLHEEPGGRRKADDSDKGGVIADWIEHDLRRGYALDFIKAQYGAKRVTRYLNRRSA